MLIGRHISNYMSEKAAETRRKKAAPENHASIQDMYSSGNCDGVYLEEMEEIENWIGCDHCNIWFHWNCVQIYTEPSSFLGSKCIQAN